MAVELRAFKDVFKEAREAKGWTQMDAAVALGVSLRSIQSWESGEKEPRLSHLRKMAPHFGWPLPFLEAHSPEETIATRV